MTLGQIQSYVYRATQTNLVSFPLTDQTIDFNNAYERVNSLIRKWVDNYRPTLWAGSDITTGTLTPVFDSLFHELIPLYISRDRAIERNLPSINGFESKIIRLEKELEEFYGCRNYQVFTVTIASPGVVTKDYHGLQTNDRISLITSGTLPTGLSVDTYYYVIYVTEHTFKLSATRDGTAINTSVSQTGTHYYFTDKPKRITANAQNNR